MWDLPGPGLEPLSPALAGGFLTTAPPGKSLNTYPLKAVSLKAEHHSEDGVGGEEHPIARVQFSTQPVGTAVQ